MHHHGKSILVLGLFDEASVSSFSFFPLWCLVSSLSGEEAAKGCKTHSSKKCCRNPWFECTIFAARGDLSWGKLLCQSFFFFLFLSLLMVLMVFLTNNLCRNGWMLLVFVKSTEHHQADMVILQTYVLPKDIAARALQATCCLLLRNMQNLMVIWTLMWE